MTDTVNVPREPTREMTLAGAGCLPSVDGVFGLAGALSANVYRAMLEAAPKAEPVSGDWYSAESIDALVREIDVALNGESAAPQAKLCDLVKQIKELAHPEAPKVDRVDEGCPVCSGDCGAANPPVLDCPLQSDIEALKVEQEPVGWRWRFDTSLSGSMWFYGHVVPDPPENAINTIVEVQPLYTHPAPASDELLEALEAIQEIAGARATEGWNERGRLKRIEERATQAIDKHKGPQS